MIRRLVERIKYPEVHRFAKERGFPVRDFEELNRQYGEEFWQRTQRKIQERGIVAQETTNSSEQPFTSCTTR